MNALFGGNASPTVLIGVFVAALALSVISSQVLATDIDRLGARLRLPEAFFGIVVALGADAPEISTAITAISSGQHDIGLGVVLGSDIVNLAALLGLSAVVANGVHIGRQTLLLNGTVALVVTAVGVGMVLDYLPIYASIGFLLVLLAVYVYVSYQRPDSVERLPLPERLKRFFCSALESSHKDARKNRVARSGTASDALSLVPALVTIVLSSILLVNTASKLGGDFGIPQAVTGALVLASLTGIPNVVAALSLARAGRGSAVVSEALNSNSLNILSGICLPALLVGLGALSPHGMLAAWWLLGMTIVAIAFTSLHGGLSRREGALLMAGYLGFAALIILGV